MTTATIKKTIAINFDEKVLNLGGKFGAAGQHWFYSFMNRHPELSIRKNEKLLSIARQKVSIDKKKKFLIY